MSSGLCKTSFAGINNLLCVNNLNFYHLERVAQYKTKFSNSQEQKIYFEQVISAFKMKRAMVCAEPHIIKG